MKTGNLNLLEPSGPVRACTGIPFYLTICDVHDPKPELDLSGSIKTTSRVIASETTE
jgi:hypothetical protein